MGPRVQPESFATRAPHGQMTVEEFLAFTDTRPDGERWELIEGVPVLQQSPSKAHQIIASNIASLLRSEKRRRRARWLPLLGVGTLVPISPRSLPEPDVMVLQNTSDADPYGNTTEDALVLFEILSRSNSKRDQAWRRHVYASVPNCQHYVTVHQRRLEVLRYDRANGWEPVKLTKADATLELPALGAHLPLAEIYADTPPGEPSV